MRPRIALALALAALAAGCGDERSAAPEPSAAVEETVQRLLTSTEPDVCQAFATQRFLASVRDQAGDEAVGGCRIEIAGRTAEQTSLGIEELVVEGTRARVRLESRAPFHTVLDLGLVEDDGTWKADTLEVVSFERAALLTALRHETLALARAFGSERRARCMLSAVGRLSNAQLAGLALGREDALAERLNGSC